MPSGGQLAGAGREVAVLLHERDALLDGPQPGVLIAPQRMLAAQKRQHQTLIPE